MKMKTIVRIASIVLMLSLMLMPLSSVVFGETVDKVPNPKDYTGKAAEVGAIQNIGGQIITIVSVVGSIASVIVLVVIGLKYMMGSTEDKAEYKKSLLPYVIGAALIFAASVVAQVVYNFFIGL